MDNLFTIASIVIAVSGATYSALVGIRTLLRDRVDKILGQSEANIGEIRDSSQEENPKNAEKKFRRLGWWDVIWRWSFAVPIILFTLVAYWLAMHVCWAHWDSSSTSLNCWDYYRWVIVALTALDALCLVLTGIAYWQIRANGEDLSDIYNAFLEAEQNLKPREEPS